MDSMDFPGNSFGCCSRRNAMPLPVKQPFESANRQLQQRLGNYETATQQNCSRIPRSIPYTSRGWHFRSRAWGFPAVEPSWGGPGLRSGSSSAKCHLERKRLPSAWANRCLGPTLPSSFPPLKANNNNNNNSDNNTTSKGKREKEKEKKREKKRGQHTMRRRQQRIERLICGIKHPSWPFNI